jgi:hypothetical protein
MKKTVAPIVGQAVRANWMVTHFDPVLRSPGDLRPVGQRHSILITLVSADEAGAELQIEAPPFVEVESPDDI